MKIKTYKKLNKKELLRRLLSNGLFPEKLSGVLKSNQFGAKIIQNHFSKNISTDDFYYAFYNQSRESNGFRRLGIPNPYPYYLLSEILVDHWSDIEKVIGKINQSNSRSQIRPKVNNKGKRLVSMSHYNKDEDFFNLIINKSIGKKYIVKTDISNYYPSIYTHAIAWALVGRKIAKMKKVNKGLWYNKIDFHCRMLQDKETIGIPIGPDTSSIIGEIILSAVDSTLTKYEYTRFIDDYTAFVDSKDYADEFLIDLANSLNEYRLSLNHKKTFIQELPDFLNTLWVSELKIIINNFLSKKEYNKKDINNIEIFWDKSLEIQNSNANSSVLRYSAKAFSSKIFIDGDTIDYAIRRLGYLCVYYPYITDCWVKLIYRSRNNIRKNTNIKKNIILISETIMRKCIQQRNSDAVTYILWLFKKLKYQFKDYSFIINEVKKYKDCVSLTLLRHYDKEMKIKTRFDPIIDEIKSEELENEYWLFIYESYKLDRKNKIFNNILHKDIYDHLLKLGVSFVN